MIHPDAAAIDIGSTMHMAAVNPSTCGTPVRAFGTFTRDLHALAVELHAKVSQLVADLHLKLSHLILPFSTGLRGSAEEGDLHGNSIEGAALGSYR